MLPAPEAATAKTVTSSRCQRKHQTVSKIQHPAPFHCTRSGAGVQWKEYDFMAKRNAAGNGTIRKKTVKRNGKDYVFWEARYTVGTDPGTGKQIQRSISGKTQKEVAQKLKAATVALDTGTYIAPSKMTSSPLWVQFASKLCKRTPFRIFTIRLQRIQNLALPCHRKQCRISTEYFTMRSSRLY